MKKRLFFLPLFAAVLAFSAFLRSAGSDNVRMVQVAALIATGMGLGVALAHLKLMLSTKSQG